MTALNDIKRIHINRDAAWYTFSTRIRREGISWGWAQAAQPLSSTDFLSHYFTEQGLALFNALVQLPGVLSVKADAYAVQLVIPEPFSAADYYQPVIDLIKSTLFNADDEIEVRTVDHGPDACAFAESERYCLNASSTTLPGTVRFYRSMRLQNRLMIGRRAILAAFDRELARMRLDIG